MAKSKKRLKMGEEAWAECQTERNRKKVRTYYSGTGKYATAWRIRVKEKLIAYKGGKCERCGYDKSVPRAYDFHHRDASQKDFGIGTYKVLNFEKLKKEVDKCDLLCRNCHAEIHDELQKAERQKLLEAHTNWLKSRLQETKCKQCNKKFQPKKARQKYCSPQCGDLGRRIVQRPGRQELTRMLEEMSREEIGRQYNVSGNTIKKWSK